MKVKPVISKLTGVQQYDSESIEDKVRRIMENKEPISDGAPIIYTDRKDGVQAGYNIRSDRFEIAIEATDKITRSKLAEREARGKAREEAKVVKLPEAGSEPKAQP